jgi:hypothetical protein
MRQRRLQVASGLVGLLQPDRIRIVGTLQHVDLKGISVSVRRPAVRIQALGKPLFQFLRRAKNFLPAGILQLEP